MHIHAPIYAHTRLRAIATTCCCRGLPIGEYTHMSAYTPSSYYTLYIAIDGEDSKRKEKPVLPI